MAITTFVAFASGDTFVRNTIETACKNAESNDIKFFPWSIYNPTGSDISKSVLSWVENADKFIADVSVPNTNVTHEIGLALGLKKNIKLIRASNQDRKNIEDIGLFHNLGHEDFSSASELQSILLTNGTNNEWPIYQRRNDTPIYMLESSSKLEGIARKAVNSIKKTMKYKFRSFNSKEIDRLTANEAYEQVTTSFGIIAFWDDIVQLHNNRHNQRAAFCIGIARGRGIPFRLFVKENARIPLDLDEIATRYKDESSIDAILRDFREDVAIAQEEYVEVVSQENKFLDKVHCGDPAAENEATQLYSYFIETEQFRAVQNGNANILLGRKGSGKSAIFYQVRDRTRNDKNNIVIDLAPEGFQLVKLKEFIIKNLELGTRKEFIAAFWEYIVWLEIAYKLLEKDRLRVRYDSNLVKPFELLETEYKKRADISGDFSSRLENLTETIANRFTQFNAAEKEVSMKSSKVLEMVYGSEIRTIRDAVLSYLKIKGIVFFLFDNLDRFWTPSGFVSEDALIVIGLIESLQDISRRFRRENIDFFWALFLRSDVYEFVVKGMADYGKLSTLSVEWSDRELLAKLLEVRLLRNLGNDAPSFRKLWDEISIQTVKGIGTIDFLVNSSFMRPRYLIRLFETARRRAITLGREKIIEEDYVSGLEELGWQVLEDFNRELVDIVPNADELLFSLAGLGDKLRYSVFREETMSKIANKEQFDLIFDILVWSGCVGIEFDNKPYFISDCGFKRQFISSKIKNNPDIFVKFHPTLSNLFER